MNTWVFRLVTMFYITISVASITGCGEDSPSSYTIEQIESKASDYYSVGEYAESAKWYQAAAKRNSIDAWYMLGEMYRTGTGVGKDYILAVKWLRDAAGQGNVRAKTQLGKMYRYGDGIGQELEKALWQFRGAAEKGNSEAQHELGMMYQEGVGVEQDYTKAMEYLYAAAEQGNESAKRMIKENLARGRGGKDFGVASIRLGMTVAQIKRTLGDFDLISPQKALALITSGGLLNIESVDPEYVDTVYEAVNKKTGAGLMGAGPVIDQNTEQFYWNQAVFEKDGFKFLSLKFTRKELGPKLLAMDVSREFGTPPDWDAIEQKLIEKYGKPNRSDKNLSKMLSEFSNGEAVKQYLWGKCKGIDKGLDMSKCEDKALLVSFEEGKTFLSQTYLAGVMMQFVDGGLAKENEMAIQKAKQAKKQAKETKTASQLDNLSF